MDYEKLTVEQRKQMVEQRMLQYESEYFNHDLNEKLLVTQLVGKTGAERTGIQAEIAVAQQSKATLDVAYAQAKKELAGIK